jgi:hypothetical protein
VLDIDDSYKNAHKNNVVDNIDGFLAVVWNPINSLKNLADGLVLPMKYVINLYRDEVSVYVRSVYTSRNWTSDVSPSS